MWSQICEKEAYMYTKLLLEKSANTKKEKNTKKHERVYNLCRILGTKLVLVDF